MNQPTYIDKNKPLDISLDFNELRKEGIKYVQELTGSFWTDFNIHDPGVTILEQLCYALTELSFRTDFDIEQLLFREGKDDLPFFRPEEILTNNPLSATDFRKLILDNITDIKNIWFEPVKEEEAAFNGLYRILVDTSLISVTEEKENEIVEKIYKIFSDNRNLCEDIFEVRILDQLPIRICADIETDGLNELGQIMAHIYFAVEQHVNPEVKFYSLGELLNMGKNYSEIFDGPMLKNGFVLSEDLVSQPETIVISDLVKLIMQVEGVVSVKNLHLELNGEKYYNQLAIPKNKIPKFIHNDILNDAESYSIKFYKGNLEYNGFNADNFRKYLNELVSEHKKAFRIKESTFDAPEVRQGLNFENYYSIQEHFPAIYGLGSEGLPNKSTIERKARVNQLKGYLMLFEQFLANYFSQLAHFKDLLSIHKKLDNTYFYQYLDSVPDSEKIYAAEEEQVEDPYLDFGSIPKNYKEGLPGLNGYFDDFVDRKNRMLDFLLAVHGESYTKYSLSQFNYYYSEEAFKKFQIKCKSALLQQLADINYNRSAGLDYYHPGNNDFTGLEKKLKVILGLGLEEDNHGKINIKKKESLFNILDYYNIKLLTSDSPSEQLSSWREQSSIKNIGHTGETINSQFDYIDDEDLDSIDPPEKEKLIKKLLPFKSHLLTTDFMISGIELINYKAGKIEGEKEGYALVHRDKEESEWKCIGEFDSEYELWQGVKLLIEMLVLINIETEGFHLVEHILLRPKQSERKYGIYIKDQHGNYLLKSNKQYSLEERKEILKTVYSNINVYDNFSVHADENKDMNIVFNVPESDISFSSLTPDVSVEEAHSKMEDLYKFLSDKEKTTPFEQKTGFYIQYDEQETDIPEDYFTYKISLVFPEWTARFNNQEFKSIVKDLVWEQKPATVYCHLHWLSPSDMRAFEKLYTNWQSKRLQQTSEDDHSNEAGSSQLIRFLFKNDNSL
jgi:hypothetical protein